MLPILIAEDDGQLGRALVLYLESVGFAVSMHSTAEAARQAFLAADREFEFALIDYHLGKDCGLELARWLLARSPRLSIVLMSGYLPDDNLNLTTLGENAIFLQKPFHPKDVISCFRSLRPMLMMSI